MDIVFIRHGRTKMNDERRYCGMMDVDISAEGIEEVKKTAFVLQNSSFDGIFTSPLIRAIQTVELLSDKYMVDTRLREINFGLFEGLTYQEILQNHPVENEKWQKDYLNYCLPKGESLQEVYQRTKDFVMDVSQRYNRVLAVTHSGIIRCALSLVFNHLDYFFRFQVHHAVPTVITIENGFMYIKGINSFIDVEENDDG